MAGDPGPLSPAELKQRIGLEKEGEPFVMHRGPDGAMVTTTLAAASSPLVIGRAEDAGIALPWDDQVSRTHAELVLVGSDWAVVDDGLSTNGTFVNGERVQRRQRLRDGDRIQAGGTVLVFRAPGAPGGLTVRAAGDPPARLSPAQRRVLVELCRPYRDGTAFTTPPSNQQVAAALFLSPESVKTHVRALFQRFEVENLPANQKRARLVELAFHSGEITTADLDEPG